MQTPIFSIVIPTKNRPALLEDAIKSCVLQNFESFEVIVSDNHNDQETQEVFLKYKSNNKFRVVKPEMELNMLDHWEFATKNAVGQYVIVLTDRSVLCQNALQIIHTQIKKYPRFNCFAFGTKSYSEIDQKFNARNTTGKTRTYDSAELIDNFKNKLLYSNESYDFYFPKSINSCYKNSFAIEIRAKYGFYFNIPGVSTPDYSSFFINCLTNKTILNIGSTLMLSQGSQLSNGGNFSNGDISYLNSIKNSFSEEYRFSKLPFIYNLIYNDLIEVNNHLKPNHQYWTIQIDSYYSNLLHEIEIKRFSGAPEKYIIELEKQLKIEMFNAGFNQNSYSVLQLKVKRKFSYQNEKYQRLKRTWRIHIQDFLYSRLKKQNFINKIYTFHYDSILHAAGFKQSLK